MDTNRIRYFLSLSKTGSITKAAELHHISPAAFSKAIKVFEEEVGHELTLPHGRGLILTDYAKSLINSLESVIQQIDSIREGKTVQKQSERDLRIATFEVFSTYFMAKTIKEFFQDFKCQIQEAIPGKMEEAVASGRADLALTYIPIPHAELDFLKVQEIEMGIFGSPKILNRAGLSEIPFVVPIGPVDGSPNKVRGLDGWPDDAFPRNSVFHVELLETALSFCREGMAAAYLPKFVVNLHNEIVKPNLKIDEFALPSRFPKTKSYVYLIKRKSDVEGSAAKKMGQAIRRFCK